ncbi:MAG TPA: hypothetical protein VFB43_00955 [Terracidiphilus sp.]|nr:hypothetical protein [Terracidiphilus sp.]
MNWDLTSTHSLEAACEWIRKGSGALFVVAVRAGAKPDEDGRFTEESAIAVDPNMPIREVMPRLELETSALVAALVNARDAEGKKRDRISRSKQIKR